MRYRWTVAVILALASSGLLLSAEKSIRVGKKPGQVRGRWLEVQNLQKLKDSGTVCLGEVTSEIKRKEGKETPIDEEILNGKIQEHLIKNLQSADLFEEIFEEPPRGENTSCLVRLDAELLVEPGSRTARYFVGFGAGKSKSILEIHLLDHESGERLGRYHGYGTGSGMGFKVAGGGARKMTQDDIQENTKKFVELLTEVLSSR